MRRYLLILSIFALSLGSCNIPGLNEPSQPIDEPLATDITPTLEETAVTNPTSSATLPAGTPTISPGQVTPTPSLTIDPQLTAGEKVYITTIQMLNEINGWAIGHQDSEHDHILRTFDGGGTWIDISPPQPLPESNAYPQNA
ncbi:MAG: hypothetical protein ABFS03_14505, partial [Chloroflexota bacterium]